MKGYENDVCRKTTPLISLAELERTSAPAYGNPAGAAAWKNNVMMEMGSGSFFARERIWQYLRSLGLPDKEQIRTVSFLDRKPSPAQFCVDVSQNRDGSVVAWAVPLSAQEQGGFALYIAGDGGVNGSVACPNLFDSYSNLSQIHFNGNFHTDEAQDMTAMFARTRLRFLDISSLNTGSVTCMCQMFLGCELASPLDLSRLDTSAVTSMANMFRGFSAPSVNLSGFRTERVESMVGMFAECRVPRLDVSCFQTHRLQKTAGMFERYAGDIYLGNADFWRVKEYMTYRPRSFQPFMDDSRGINGHHWTQMFGLERFEIRAPKDGDVVIALTIYDHGVTVKKGQLVATFSTRFTTKNLYAPCNGVVAQRGFPGVDWQYKMRKFCQKDDLIFVFYSLPNP